MNWFGDLPWATIGKVAALWTLGSLALFAVYAARIRVAEARHRRRYR